MTPDGLRWLLLPSVFKHLKVTTLNAAQIHEQNNKYKDTSTAQHKLYQAESNLLQDFEQLPENVGDRPTWDISSVCPYKV